MTDTVYPLCVIDVTEKVASDPCYAVTVEDIQEYEAHWGSIPDGAFVALYTGGSKFWPDMNSILGIADDVSENFPGWSLPALRYIYKVRTAASGDLTCERYVLERGELQMELLRYISWCILSAVMSGS